MIGETELKVGTLFFFHVSVQVSQFSLEQIIFPSRSFVRSNVIQYQGECFLVTKISCVKKLKGLTADNNDVNIFGRSSTFWSSSWVDFILEVHSDRVSLHFFIGISIFHLSKELITKFWKTSPKSCLVL